MAPVIRMRTQAAVFLAAIIFALAVFVPGAAFALESAQAPQAGSEERTALGLEDSQDELADPAGLAAKAGEALEPAEGAVPASEAAAQEGDAAPAPSPAGSNEGEAAAADSSQSKDADASGAVKDPVSAPATEAAASSASEGTSADKTSSTASTSASKNTSTASSSASASTSAAKTAAVDSIEETVSPKVSYRSHVSNVGWKNYATNGGTSSGINEGEVVEAIRVKVEGIDGGVTYAVYAKGAGWQSAKSNAATAGSTGKNLPIQAIRAKLTGNAASTYDLFYRVYVRGIGWLDWTRNWYRAGTYSFGRELQGIQMKLVLKGDTRPKSSDTVVTSAYVNAPTVSVASHIENIGWQSAVGNNKVSGTVGQGLRMEAVKITVSSSYLTGEARTSAHVQNIGWKSYVGNGKIAGTTGQALRVEAIKLGLSKELGEIFDVKYKVHVQNYGWMDWVSAYEMAGTSGQALRLEGIMVYVTLKDKDAAVSTVAPPATPKSIMGASQASAAVLAEWYKSKGRTYPSSVMGAGGASTIDDFAKLVVSEAKAEGVRAEVAFAQAMLETGWLNYGGSVKANQYNFCGLKNAQSTGFESFKDVQTGIRAHIQHLKAYASTDPLVNTCVDPRFAYVTRGKAPTIDGLAGTWAEDGDYANKIYGFVQEIMARVDTSSSSSSGSNSGSSSASGSTSGSSSSSTVTGDAKISYRSHVSNVGWKYYQSNGATSSGIPEKQKVEAISVKLSGVDGGVKYSVYAKGIGWQSEKTDTQTAGTTGQSLPIQAIRAELTGKAANAYDLYYRVYVVGLGWLDWTSNWSKAGTYGYDRSLQGLQMKLVNKKGAAPKSSDSVASTAYVSTPTVSVSAHLSNKGWLTAVGNKKTAGSTTEGLQLEALKASVTSSTVSGGLNTKAHVENIGWQSYVGNGKIAGTTGKAYHVEAIQMKLTGDMANVFHVYYRAFIEGFGWLDWARNGTTAGSTGKNLQVEAVQVYVTLKGSYVPGSMTTPNLNDRATYIYLDAGHGLSGEKGYDPGAVGSGYKEADLTKELVGKVAEYAKSLYGLKVYNNTGSNLNYTDRQAAAQKLGCTAYLSIHFNAAGGTGTETYIHANNAAAGSSTLQNIVHQNLVAATGLANRGAKEECFAVLSGNVPAVLCEICFIDNASDMAAYEKRKDTIAKALAKSLAEAAKQGF